MCEERRLEGDSVSARALPIPRWRIVSRGSIAPMPDRRGERSERIRGFSAALAIFVLVLVADWPSFDIPFPLDDHNEITHRELRRDGPLAARACRPPPGGTPVSGRPLVNVSFAANYA